LTRRIDTIKYMVNSGASRMPPPTIFAYFVKNIFYALAIIIL